MTRDEAQDLIVQRKQDLGEKLIILGHHYQTDDIISFSDFVGDSLELARKAAQVKEAEIIVFCGVYFMAETASIVAPDKDVYIPEKRAGCPLADMADVERVEEAWSAISRISDSIVPVTYVNSSAEIKAFCGKHSGTVCTSGNAARIFEWAFSRARTIFFMPDKNLGMNTARELEISPSKVVLWDPDARHGGLSDGAIRNARVILWKGWCPVHWPEFSVSDVRKMRAEHPGIKIIVHPESDPETVDMSDRSGSTAQILSYIRSLQPGEKVAVGTECHMVERAAKDYQSVLDIMALKQIYCDDMGKITLEKLADTLMNLDTDEHRVRVSEPIASNARKALEIMLKVSE
ncbi:MAG: quinolinate synthase NadA [Desulfomonilia bacterium]